MSLLPLPWPADPVEGQLGHFDHSNWTKESLIALDEGMVPSTGGSFTGDIEITDAALMLRGESKRLIEGRSTEDLMRWRILLGDATSESVGDVGSRFMLSAYGDDGIKRFTVLLADRISGLLQVAGPPVTELGIATKAYVDQQMPIGAIIMWGGTAAPTGWHLCDGSVHGSSTLQGILGSASTPNLRDRFIVGAGSSYAKGATGGLSTVTLTGAQSGEKGHNHGAVSGVESGSHTHSGSVNSGGNHKHPSPAGYNYLLTAVGGYAELANDSGGVQKATGYSTHTDWEGSHTHSYVTGGRSATHTHGITVYSVGSSNASQSHENKPPYYALTFIIKKV